MADGMAGSRVASWRSFGAGRWLVLAVGVVLALYSAAFSFALIFSGRQPAVTMALVPWHSTAPTAIADRLMLAAAQEKFREAGGRDAPTAAAMTALLSRVGPSLPPEKAAPIRELALEGLSQSALNSAALRQLAFLEKDRAKRKHLLDLALRVSRRDVLAGVQSAEIKFLDNEADAGLADLDRALTVSEKVDDLVLPIILQASSDPEALAQIRRRVAKNPLWIERLLRYGIDNPVFAPRVADIVSDIPARSTARAQGYGQQLIDILVSAREYPAAFKVYDVYSPTRQAVERMGGGAFRPIDWQLTENYDAGGRELGAREVDIFASPERQGEFARILMRSRPGSYSLSLRAREVEAAEGRLTFNMLCLDEKQERQGASLSLPLRQGPMRFDYSVPPTGCGYQWLILGIGAELDSAAALIDSVTLSRTPARVAGPGS